MSNDAEQVTTEIRHNMLQLVPPEQHQLVERFFAGASLALGASALDDRDARRVAIIVPEEDVGLGRCFAVRDRLSDVAFERAFRAVEMPRFSALCHPHKRAALVKVTLAVELQPAGGPTRKRVTRGFLFVAEQVGGLLRRFSERDTTIWLIREQDARDPARIEGDVLRRCLPIGFVTSDTPIQAIELALAHVGRAGERW